jgi:hypothetical protein
LRDRRKRCAIAFLAAGFLLGATGIRAAFSNQVSVTNEIQVGDVDISLREYELADGREVSYSDPKIILPGETISKIPRITNQALPCWVRVRLQWQDDNEELEGLSDQDLYGFSSNWILQGDYYYYKEILKSGESVDLFHEIVVPKTWDSLHSGQNLSLDIQAEAIQAANFTPDFEAMSPWGNQEIQVCIHEADDRIETARGQVQHKIELNGEAHRLIAVSEDFFSNFKTAMPGDSLCDEAQLCNTTDHAANLYFYTEPVSLSQEETQLLKRLRLELRLDGVLLYSGGLYSESLEKANMLTRLEPGESGTLTFTVGVPGELDNAYALGKTSVKWVFYTDESESLSTTPTPEKTETDTSESGNKADIVQTGDPVDVCRIIWILLTAWFVAAVVIRMRMGGKRQ